MDFNLRAQFLQIYLCWLITLHIFHPNCLCSVGRWCYRSRSSSGAGLWFKKSVWCHQGDQNSSTLQHGVLPSEWEFCSSHSQWWQGNDLGIKIQHFWQKYAEQVMGFTFLTKAAFFHEWCSVFHCVLKATVILLCVEVFQVLYMCVGEGRGTNCVIQIDQFPFFGEVQELYLLFSLQKAIPSWLSGLRKQKIEWLFTLF